MSTAYPTSEIAIVIPAYNESATIHDVASRALNMAPLVIVVDDGSTDATLQQLEDLPVTLVKHQENRGKAASLWDGIQQARQHPNVQYIITLDGDGQHAPEDIPRLMAKLETHPRDIIIGARLADKSAIPAKRYYANRIANFWLAWAAGYPISDSQSGFRIYPAMLFEGLVISTSRRRSFVFESEILIRAAQRGIYSCAVAIPAIYTQQARPSHFRGVRDITYITLMVARSLFSRGFYPQGLYRSAIKPHLLPRHQGHYDYAGYLTASLSLLVILATGGITLLIALAYTWRRAITTASEVAGNHIVVLGKRLQNNVPDQDYRLRLERAAALYQADTSRHLYILGGNTGDAEISESLAGLHYLERRGVNTEHIHLEQSSRNTLENINQLKSRVMIPEQRIILITNRYHLARAGMMAGQFGYKVELCAAETEKHTGLMSKLHYFAEAVLLHWYVTGLIYARITNNKAMLTRIGH